VGCASGPNPDETIAHLLRDSPWYRSEIRGITVYANTDPDQTRRLMAKLSRFLQLVEFVSNDDPFVPDQPVDLLFFARESQWRSFSELGTLGHARNEPGRYRLGISAEASAYDVLYHELVHLALYLSPGGAYPRWYHEGLAETLGSAVIRDGVAVVGSVPPLRREPLSYFEALPLEEILSDRAARKGVLAARFYADSFAFVHYALLADRMGGKDRVRELHEFVRLLRARTDWREALSRAISADLPTVEAEFRTHRAKLVTQEVGLRVVIELEDRAIPALELEQLGESDTARALAAFGTGSGLDPDVADRLWMRVLEAVPDDPEALLGRVSAAAARGETDDANARLAALPDADRVEPAFSRVAAEVAVAESLALSERDPTRALARVRAARDLYRAVIERQPNDAAALKGVGWTYVCDEDSDAEVGIEAFQRAEHLWSGDPQIDMGLAELYFRTGDDERARKHLDLLLFGDLSKENRKRAEELAATIDRRTPR
jgi:tetratricopeptide (TPR) repeat protein